MRLPTRISPAHPLRKIIASILIAAIAAAIGFGLHRAPGTSVAMAALDDTLYDAVYRLRPVNSRADGQIVIVTVDEQSLSALAGKPTKWQWPWPRNCWEKIVQYLGAAGARAVVFDLIFKEPRAFDQEFGAAIDSAKVPLVLGNMVQHDGSFDYFAPQAKKPPTFGAVNTLDETVVRDYVVERNGKPALAIQAVTSMGEPIPNWAGDTFRLHYYGPNANKDGTLTYNYLPAYRLAKAAFIPKKATDVGITPGMFKDKIVLIGGTAAAIYDVKSSPLSGVYPGTEVQATAIDNLLNGQYVHPISTPLGSGIVFEACLLAALGVTLPRSAYLKTLLAAGAILLLCGISVVLFRGATIHWLPMAWPIVALLLSIVGAFAWTYFAEDRQRQLVLKALSQYVSPEVASEISHNPDALRLGGQRREMTVMFTDIQGFTDLSETMDSEALSKMLNFYLGEMSGLILSQNGTLDKYIGDAIMSFWNAPVLQPDHAARACRAALAMKQREADIQPELAALGAKGMLTRLGINTGPMVFGNMGAPQKFNYSVLGDSVNLGSRLEGANKIYGSRILVAETTVALVKDQFILRKLDLLRVKGKQKPLAVYELLGEGTPTEIQRLYVEQYDRAFAAYQSQSWDEAEAILTKHHEAHAEDLPAAALLKRVQKLRHDPPPAPWDGVYVAKDK